MKKLKAVYGEWLQSFCSCNVEAYESFVKTSQKLPTFNSNTQLNDRSVQIALPHHSWSVKLTDLNNSQTKGIEETAKYQQTQSNLSQSESFSLTVKSANNAATQSYLKDFDEIWIAFEQPPYQQDVFLIFLFFF